MYSHNRAGVASLFAALTDQERSRSFSLKHLLRLRPAQLANKPARLILMRQILLISLQHIRAGKNKSHIVTSPYEFHLHAVCCFKCSFLKEWVQTYSSRLSLSIPSQSFMRFCRTPLWLSQLQRRKVHKRFNFKHLNNYTFTEPFMVIYPQVPQTSCWCDSLEVLVSDVA